ncbi:MAG: TetR/AcrR family transcriptional regulator [Pseudomonadales bacterium]|jgi:AcrR family transcriptional regulator
MAVVLGEPKGKGASYGNRKLEVLRTAATLFNERGFHNTTMDDIAARLKVTKPALYHYAKGKDELLFEIGSIAIDEAMSFFDTPRLVRGSGAEQLEQFFIAWTKSICKPFGRCLVLTKPEILEPASREVSKDSRRRIQRQVVDLIQVGVDDGSINTCDARLIALALFDLFNGIAYWYSDKGELAPEEIAAQFWRSFGIGLLS